MSDPHPGDPTRGFHGGNAESNAAHASLPNKAALRERIVIWIGKRGARGATGDEVEIASGLPHQTVSARITEAKHLGLIAPNGERRPTRSGRNAAVLVRTSKPIHQPAQPPA